jgi:hypothetical protein
MSTATDNPRAEVLLQVRLLFGFPQQSTKTRKYCLIRLTLRR